MENTILNVINTRRSVRKFTNKTISETDIKEILEAGMNAPSAGNEQAWHFIVMTDKSVMEEYSKLNKNVAYLKSAAAAILVCGNTKLEKYAGYHFHDCCAATENILLAIHAKGMGGVWGAVFPNTFDGIRGLLNLPENLIPVSVIPFGYFEEKTQDAESRYDKQKVHWNKFQNS
ncbi:MAG: nitroreductase family protein [Bacteroidales bacterium]|nr:nitroreductase family protein [Bacteroidales bacterium]